MGKSLLIEIYDSDKILNPKLSHIFFNDRNAYRINIANSINNLINNITNLSPDIIFLGFFTIEDFELKLIKRVKKYAGSIPLLIYSYRFESQASINCLRENVNGIICGDFDSTTIIQAINTVSSGDKYFCPQVGMVIRQLMQRYQTNTDPDKKEESIITKREAEIISLFAEGYSYKEIADRLNISSRTVESHKNNILSKLKLTSTADIIKYAVRNHLIIL
jgi:RNA polymerase sigma factor (sigma-70 family)